MAAESSQQSLVKALGVAIGCPVTLHMSLDESSTLEQDSKTKGDTLYSLQYNTTKYRRGESSQGSRLTKSKSCSTSRNPTSDPQTSLIQTAVDSKHAVTPSMKQQPARHRWSSLSSIPQSDASVEPYSQDVIYANKIQVGIDSKHGSTRSMKVIKEPTRHRRLSSSSTQQNDASVEPYSRDIIYANFNNDAIRNKGLSKSSRFQASADEL